MKLEFGALVFHNGELAEIVEDPKRKRKIRIRFMRTLESSNLNTEKTVRRDTVYPYGLELQ